MKTEAAEALAAQALAWMARDDELVGRFLASTGAAPGDLAQAAGDPAFLGFVLDFLMADEESARAFAEAERLPPEMLRTARARLPGGMTPEWT
ncbi:MAG: DUF3572 domain-containing protein [Pseudomonadota bacterium]